MQSQRYRFLLPQGEVAPGCTLGRRQAGGGSVSDSLVLDITAYLQKSSGVYASTGPGCFGGKKGTYPIGGYGRWL